MELSVSELWRYVCASDGYDTTRNPCQEAVDLVVPSGIDKGQKLLQRVSCSLTSTSSGDAKEDQSIQVCHFLLGLSLICRHNFKNNRLQIW